MIVIGLLLSNLKLTHLEIRLHIINLISTSLLIVGSVGQATDMTLKSRL